MKPTTPLAFGLFFWLAYFLINIAADLPGDFHQLHNDYWDLLFIAKNIDFCNAYSLVNPCIPIGYTSLLHFLIASGSEITVPIVVNLLFGTTTLFISIVFYQKAMNRKTSILAAALVGFFPLFFFYSNQGGADPGSVMFFTAGALLLLHQSFFEEKNHWLPFAASGALMGLGALFRFHVLAGSVIFIFTAMLFNIRKWRLLGVAMAGVCICYLPQIAVNLLTHHGALETKLSSSSIYDLMYGINWFKTSTVQFPDKALAIISTDYFLFFKKYCFSFAKFFLQTGAVPLAASLLVHKPREKKISWFITIFTVIYFGLFSATSSGRQVLLPLPLTMLCFGFLVEELFSISQQQKQLFRIAGRVGTIMLITAIGILFLTKDVARCARNRYEAKLAYRIESYLSGLGCTDAHQIYTTDFDIYFRNLPNYTGFFNGGWSRWGTYNYNESFPEFNVESIDGFIQDCRKRQVRFLLLTGDSDKLSREIGDLHMQNLQRDDVVFKKGFDRIRVFQLQ